MNIDINETSIVIYDIDKPMTLKLANGKVYIVIRRNNELCMTELSTDADADLCNHVWSDTTAIVNGSKMLVCLSCQKISYE
ncbi:MAG: hypothetical protein EBU66_15895 [Bacteroidetes bacterium]|nr:hypothetical protein [Bacteroidota bacterium]